MPVVMHEGWLTVPYDGPDAAVVYIGLAEPNMVATWIPAFLGYVGGQRVAKIRAAEPGPLTRVYLRSPLGDEVVRDVSPPATVGQQWRQRNRVIGQ